MPSSDGNEKFTYCDLNRIKQMRTVSREKTNPDLDLDLGLGLLQ